MFCARMLRHTVFFKGGHYLSASAIARCNLHKLSQCGGIRHVVRQQFIVPKRGIKFQSSGKKTGRFTPHYRWDRVPRYFSLIYESNLKNWIGGYYAGIAAIGLLGGVVFGYEVPKHSEAFGQEDLMSFYFILGLVVTIIGVTNFFARRFVIRIYQDIDSGQFIALHYSFLGRLKQIRYTLDDIDFKFRANPEVEDGTTVKIKGNYCHLSSQDFVSPSFYNMHLGHGEEGSVRKSYVSRPKF